MADQNRDRCCYIAQSTKRQCRVNPGNDKCRESRGLLPLCGAHQRWERRSDLNDCIIEEWRSEDAGWINNSDSHIPEGIIESASKGALLRRGNTLWGNISEHKRHLVDQVAMFNAWLHKNDTWSDMKRHYISDLLEKLYFWQQELSHIEAILEARKQLNSVVHHVSPSASAIQAPTIQ